MAGQADYLLIYAGFIRKQRNLGSKPCPVNLHAAQHLLYAFRKLYPVLLHYLRSTPGYPVLYILYSAGFSVQIVVQLCAFPCAHGLELGTCQTAGLRCYGAYCVTILVRLYYLGNVRQSKRGRKAHVVAKREFLRSGPCGLEILAEEVCINIYPSRVIAIVFIEYEHIHVSAA